MKERSLGFLGRIQEFIPENESGLCHTAMPLPFRFKKKDFLHKMVICDKKWILYDNLKRQKFWVYPIELLTSTVKSNIHAKEFCCVFTKTRRVLFTMSYSNPVKLSEHYQQLIRVMHLRRKGLPPVVEERKWFCCRITYTVCRKNNGTF